MAKKVETTITVTDDLDGSKADRTVTFTVDGNSYEIDLSKKNATAFDKALAPYIGAARKAPRSTGRPRGSATARGSKRNDLSEIRTWANAQGLNVSERGRIPGSVLDAYDSAH